MTDTKEIMDIFKESHSIMDKVVEISSKTEEEWREFEDAFNAALREEFEEVARHILRPVEYNLADLDKSKHSPVVVNRDAAEGKGKAK